MSLRTLAAYLGGSRRAILEIAGERRALHLGIIFALSAALARDYDQEDLMGEPWRLAIPLAAALGASSILCLAAWIPLKLKDPEAPGFLGAWRSFAGLFLFAAPLAWLYAVPYERFLSPAEAARWNLITLGVVAAWRVFLMVRVLAVLMGYHLAGAMFLVLAFADTAALGALYFLPFPIIAVMGGIVLSPGDAVVGETAAVVLTLGALSLPLWWIGAIAYACGGRPRWRGAAPGRGGSGVRRSLWGLALASVAVWGLVLPFTQPEQVLRRRAERALESGRIAEALREMGRRSLEEYPPGWDPPPRLGHHREEPPLVEVIEALVAEPSAEWVRRSYLEKLRLELDSYNVPKKQRLLQALSAMPDGSPLASELRSRLDEAGAVPLEESDPGE
jgi:hypothetical protein